MKPKHPKIKLRSIFCSVGEAQTPHGPVLMLSQSQTLLQPVLDLLHQGAGDREIFARHDNIKPAEIASAKLFYQRFGADASQQSCLPEGPKALLLDECIPVGLTSFANDLFGFSTHVELEGLSLKNPGSRIKSIPRQMVDTVIAEFTRESGFGALVTRDHDFIARAANPDHPASKINIFMVRDGIDIAQLEAVLTLNQSAIRHALASSQPKLHILA